MIMSVSFLRQSLDNILIVDFKPAVNIYIYSNTAPYMILCKCLNMFDLFVKYYKAHMSVSDI